MAWPALLTTTSRWPKVSIAAVTALRGQRIRHVERDGAGLVWVGLEQAVQLLRAARRGDDMVAPIQRDAGDLPPYATRASGDEPCAFNHVAVLVEWVRQCRRPPLGHHGP